MIKTITALFAAAAMAATPVHAGDDEIKALIGGLIVGAIIANSNDRPSHTTNNVVVMPEYNPYNDPRHPSYARGLDDPYRVCYIDHYRTGRWIEVVHTNCYGEVVRVERRPRY
jgi:hypothetical protein